MGKLLFFAITVGGLFVFQTDDPVGAFEYIASHMLGVGILFMGLALLALFAPKLVENIARWFVLGGLALLVLTHAGEIADVIRWGFQ